MCNCFLVEGWDDIGYSFLIGGDGLIYEGRGWNKKGAHTYCYNQLSYGIAFIGNYILSTPNDAMLQAYETFLQV